MLAGRPLARDVDRPVAASTAFLVGAKFAPPHVAVARLARPRLVEQLAARARLTLVLAPSGYGKTVAVAEWAERTDLSVAWLSLDMLDGDRHVFWRHVIAALDEAHPGLGGAAAAAHESAPHDDAFLGVLLSELERSTRPMALVLDDLGRIADPEVLDALALLVDRVGDVVRLVVTTDAIPSLPLARWRAAGWLVEVDDRTLRFTAEECVELAASRGGVAAAEALAIHTRWDGWPIAVDLALRPAPAPTSGDVAPRVASLGAHGHDDMLDELAVGIISRLPLRLAGAALTLSVFEWFDARICHAVLGAAAPAVLHDLRVGHHLPLDVDPASGVMRFPRWLREALATRSAWEDPIRYAELQRRAAATWIERGQLDAARRHLLAAGDVDAANELVIGPVLAAVDRGDRRDVASQMRALRRITDVDDADTAFDLAQAAVFAGSAAEADHWFQRAAAIVASAERADRPTDLRLAATGAMLAMLHGDLAGASRHANDFERLEPGTRIDSPVDRRFATVAARIALVVADAGGARRWLGRARLDDVPTVVADVTLTGLDAWHALLTDSVDAAISLASAATAAASSHHVAPHQGALDATVTLAAAHAAAGAFDVADELAVAARADADALGFDWGRVRVGAVVVRTRLRLLGPAIAIATARDVRSSLQHPRTALVAHLLAPEEARAHVAAGRLDTARELLHASPPPRWSRGSAAAHALASAALALAERRAHDVPDLLAGSDTWAVGDRLEASVLLAASRPGTQEEQQLVEVLAEASERGWVLPFVGHGPRVDEILGRLPVASVHPRLAAVLQRGTEPSSVVTPVEPLTARERTVLVHLPSHLSYAEIAGRLYVSVNTVKSNLKSIYRKLGVSSRSAAVDAARRAGLL